MTLLLHLAKSLTSWSASSTVRPKILQSSLKLSQRFFGMPTDLFSCTLPYSMMFGMQFGNIRTTCPKYESHLERTWLIPGSFLMSTFLRRSHRLIPAKRLRTAISKTSNFWPISSVTVHVSPFYSNTDSTSALYNLVLVSNPMSLDLQITARLPATPVAGNQLNDFYNNNNKTATAGPSYTKGRGI